MQQRFEFIQFTPTPGEKYAGIAEVKINGTIAIVLRYKIVAKKDGSGFFPTCASYKMTNRAPGEEYDECFMIDSRSDNDAVNKVVMHGFHLSQQSQQPSVFNTPLSYPNIAVGYPGLSNSQAPSSPSVFPPKEHQQNFLESAVNTVYEEPVPF